MNKTLFYRAMRCVIFSLFFGIGALATYMYFMHGSFAGFGDVLSERCALILALVVIGLLAALLPRTGRDQ